MLPEFIGNALKRWMLLNSQVSAFQLAESRLKSVRPGTSVTVLRTKDHKEINTPASYSICSRRLALLLRLDYLSCVLTICSTILVGKRCWKGWVVAAINSGVVCVIGFRTGQFGFIPANVFCIGLYAVNLRSWRKSDVR